MKNIVLIIISFALANSSTLLLAKPKQAAELASLLAKALNASKVGDLEPALNDFKEVLSADVFNPSYDEFVMQIQAAENIIDIYQKFYDSRKEAEDKQHLRIYIELLSKKYDEAIDVLKQKNDFIHAISLAQAIYRLYKNNGHYTSVSNNTYEFFLELAFKNIYENKILHYKDVVDSLFRQAINASLRSSDKNATDKLIALEKQWNNGEILADSTTSAAKDKRKSIFNIFK